MNIEQCIEQGLLVKTKPDSKKALSSLEMAEHKLELAEKEFGHSLFESAVVSAYTSMFHTARSLLFLSGFKERSHFAVYVFVSEKYSNRIERRFINELNSLRLYRHELMYGFEKSAEAKESDAESAIQAAEGFLKTAGKIVKEDT